MVNNADQPDSGDRASEVSDPRKRLAGIAEQLKSGSVPVPVTARTFLGWFGIQRRGYYKVRTVRAYLKEAGLVTTPDFEFVYIDSSIAFALAPTKAVVSGTASITGSATATIGEPSPEVSASASVLLGGASSDPTYRIGKLASANNPPIGVKPDSSLQEAVTVMLSHDFSQLPVMQSEFAVKGVVSWTSIGSRLALGKAGQKASDFMEPANEISADTSLFAAIAKIVANQYVLIRGAANRIVGIVTPSDLSIQFGQLAEPFLLLGEIENHVRRLIGDKFSVDEVKAARDPADAARDVKSVADLGFGEYVRLLSKPERWSKLNLAVDRAVFVAQLDQIRGIRNDVMHFDPDGVAEEDLVTLRKFGRFLMTLQELGAT
ncbi:MAG: CBS domain-containing protein [Planctomycetes bacterium]|nr:CBS domain-containing protein [Planctomycetota bacterium]